MREFDLESFVEDTVEKLKKRVTCTVSTETYHDSVEFDLKVFYRNVIGYYLITYLLDDDSWILKILLYLMPSTLKVLNQYLKV